ELANLVARHPVRTVRIDVIVVHVFVNAPDRFARALQVSQPVLGMRGAKFGAIFVNERVEYPLNVSADCRAIIRPVFIGRGREYRCCHCKNDQTSSHTYSPVYLFLANQDRWIARCSAPRRTPPTYQRGPGKAYQGHAVTQKVKRTHAKQKRS